MLEENRVPVISLMTDFVLTEGTVGVMKGVIWTICPTAQISDPSHMIQAKIDNEILVEYQVRHG